MDQARAVRHRFLALVALVCVPLLTLPLSAQEVRGVVVDQATGVPIEGVTVLLLGGDYQQHGAMATDDEGRFALAAPRPGEYVVVAQVTGYTTLVSPTIQLLRGQARQHRFEIKTLGWSPEPAPEPEYTAESMARALALMCEGENDLAEQGILVGIVRDSLTSIPLPEVDTRLEWTEGGRLRQRSRISGPDGSFVFCDAPAGKARHLSAEVAGLASSGTTFEVRRGMIKRKDVYLNLSDGGRPGDIFGTVTDHATGGPVSGAEIKLGGLNLTTFSREDGKFSFMNVPWGVYFLAVDHIAFAHQEQAIRIMGDRAHEVELSLATGAIDLDPISVTVHSRQLFGALRGFEERRDRGFGYFLDKTQIANRGAVKLVELLREIPGVRVKRARAGVQEAPGRATTNALYFRNCWRYTPEGEVLAEPPMLYVDGVKQLMIDLTRGDLDTVLPSDIEAMEVYLGPSQIPGEFGGTDSGCGVIAIWTKRGR